MKFRLLFFVLLLTSFSISVTVQAQEKKNGMVSITDKDGNVISGKNKKGKRVGLWIVKTKNGILLEEINYANGVYHGSYVRYVENGNVVKSGSYVNGLQQGRWCEFSSAGDTLNVKTYDKGVLNGYAREGSTGSNNSRGYYVNGQKEGLWIKEVKSVTGKQIDSSQYINGDLNGPYVVYRNGRLQYKGTYKDNKLHGRNYRYYPKTGQLSNSEFYQNGLRDSVWYEYWPDGSRSSVKWYTNDKPYRYDSTWSVRIRRDTVLQIQLYAAPGIVSFVQGNLRDGTPQFKQYNGEDGEPDSVFAFYGNGALYSRGYAGKAPSEQKQSRASRFETTYAQSGVVISYGWFGQGGRDSVWIYNDSVTGKKRKEITYVKGREEIYRSYYSNGKIKVAGKCRYGALSDSIRVYSAAGKLLQPESPQYKEIIKKDVAEQPSVVYHDPSEPVATDNSDEYEDYVVAIPEQPKEEEVLQFAEVMPSFPGDSLASYIQKNLVYPQAEKEAGKEGTVYVQFIVEKDGSISNVRVVKGVPGAPGLTQEAVRIIRSMPKWNPGKMNGRPVRVQFVQPIKFRIQ